MKKIVLIAVLLLVGGAYASSLINHILPDGRLVQAISFENGDALTVSETNTGLTLAYYDVEGWQLASDALYLSENPETVSVQACGKYAQVFIGYPASIEGDLSTAHAERYVWTLPHAQGCQNRVNLPFVGVP